MNGSEHHPAPPTPRREAHAHIAAHGRSLTMPDLAPCTTLAECLDRLAHQNARSRGGDAGRSWVLAHGARAESWSEARWPTRAELDRAVPDRPCAVMSFDHHSLVANSRALTAAGIDESTPDPPDGVICRDPRTGEPTGLLLERSAHQVWNSAPEPGPDERRAHVVAALENFRAHGFSEVHDLLAQPWLGPLLASLHDSGELTAGVALYVPLADLDAAARTAADWQRPAVRLAGAKVFADGTLNSRTAWMLEPYRDPMPGMPRGKPLLTADQIAAAIVRCHRLGLELAAHAIGDGAVRACLDAAERAGGCLRIEHAEIVDEADVPRFKALGVTASVQPCHLLYDVEALHRYLPHRLDRVLPLRELIDAGLEPGRRLIFGSDAPIVRPDPQDSIAAATGRGRSGGPMVGPAQSIPETTAWECFTDPSRGSDP